MSLFSFLGSLNTLSSIRRSARLTRSTRLGHHTFRVWFQGFVTLPCYTRHIRTARHSIQIYICEAFPQFVLYRSMAIRSITNDSTCAILDFISAARLPSCLITIWSFSHGQAGDCQLGYCSYTHLIRLNFCTRSNDFLR